MALGLFEQIAAINTRIKRLCCKIENCCNNNNASFKVYTALLTQNGGDSGVSIDTGLLTIGVTYRINNDSPGMDFTNVGAPNNNQNTYFVATGTTPASWGANEGSSNATLVYNEGAPVVTVLENTLGIDITYEYNVLGTYVIRLSDFVDVAKLYINVQATANNCDSAILFNAGPSGTTDIIFLTSIRFQPGFPYEDGCISSAPLEIRVYN
jgi:hypothetical protein